MKKKITAMIVCAAVALSLTACGTNGESSSPSTSSSTKSSTESSKTESSSTVSSSSTESSSDSKPEESSTESTAPEESSVPEQPAANEADFLTQAVDGGVRITGYKGSDENVVIPETIGGEKVVAIGESAFQNKIDITSVTIPDSVEHIETLLFGTIKGAFRDCINLKEVTFLGNDIPLFSFHDFENTPWLEEKRAENSDYIIINDMLLEWRKREGDVTIPDGVTRIAPLAFHYDRYNYEYDGITGITIPDSVTEIGEGAFAGCNNLKSITLPKNITRIADYTFSVCYSLETIDIPNGVTYIGYNVFSDCPANVTLPDSVAEFVGWEGSFSGTITYKGKTYSHDFTDLFDAIYFGDSDIRIVDNVLVLVKASATKIEIPETVTSIADGAFKGCDSSIIITYKGKNYNKQNLDKLIEAVNGN